MRGKFLLVVACAGLSMFAPSTPTRWDSVDNTAGASAGVFASLGISRERAVSEPVRSPRAPGSSCSAGRSCRSVG